MAGSIPTARLTDQEFRHGLKALKKAGIIDVDINRAKPFWVRSAGPKGGKYTLRELLTKYDDIVSQKAAAVSVPPAKAKEYKRIGYEFTKQGKVIVPHAATERVKVTRKGEFYMEDIHGIRRVQLPVKYHDMEQYISDLRENQKEIQRMKKKGKYFAFRYYGGHSHVFSDFDLLLDYLEESGSGTLQMLQNINEHSARDMNDLYRNLEIVEVSKPAWESSKTAAEKRRRERSTKHKRHERQRILEKLEQGPKWKLDRYHAKRAEQQRRYRANLKGQRKKDYQVAARKRAKKSVKNQRKGK